MSDLQKAPIQPGQATMPQRDNTGLKIVLVVVLIIFGFPVILTIAGLIFISANFDKVTAWLDSHIDDWSYYSVSDDEVTSSARAFYSATSGQKVTIFHDDCWNIRSVLGSGSNSATWLLHDVCEASEIKAASKGSSLYFAKGDACLELVFDNEFRHYKSYNYNSWNTDCGMNMTTIKLEDWQDVYDDDRELEPYDNHKEDVQEG